MALSVWGITAVKAREINRSCQVIRDRKALFLASRNAAVQLFCFFCDAETRRQGRREDSIGGEQEQIS